VSAGVVKRTLETPERAAAGRDADLCTHDSESNLRVQLAQIISTSPLRRRLANTYSRLLELSISSTVGITPHTQAEHLPQHLPAAFRILNRDSNIKVNSTYNLVIMLRLPRKLVISRPRTKRSTRNVATSHSKSTSITQQLPMACKPSSCSLSRLVSYVRIFNTPKNTTVSMSHVP
jgi:hypothetical protein